MVLQVQNLCKEYPQFSLRDISFQLPKGAIMGLIGENGAGKSTTMRMILGMAQPDSGQISVFGHRGVTPQDRESIGVVFDEMPFNQTLYTSHLGRVMKKIYSQWDEGAYNQYLQRFSLPDKKEIKDFSRGMKMKLSLAIALSHGAQLLILDEPTNGLDPAGIQEMRELIRDLPSRFGMTVVVSSHLLSEIDQMADTVGIIREGVLVFQDTLAALHGRSRHHLALRTTNNALAAQVLREKGIGWTEEGDYLVLPILPDEQAAGLCRALVEGRLGLVRLEERQKSLEDIFLELTGGKEVSL